MPKEYFSTAEISRLCGVHVSSVIRWVNQGLLPAAVTPGGVRRISAKNLADFMRSHNYPIPEILGEVARPGEPADEPQSPSEREVKNSKSFGGSLELLDSIIDNSPFMMQIVSRDGWTVKINHALSRTFGVDEGDIVGEGKHNFFRDKLLRKSGIAAAVEKAFTGENMTVPMAEFTAGSDLLGGTDTIYVSARCFPVQEGGVVAYVGIVYEDITEKAVLQKELLTKTAELEQFVYTVSHDLKSPLGVIFSCNQILEEVAEGSPAVQKQVNMIRRSTVRMREFIDSILSLSRAGKWEGDRDYDTPVSTIIKGIFQDLSARYPEQKMDLEVGVLPRINLHPDATTQLFQNLIENSHKYKHPERRLRISVTVTSGVKFNRYMVSDNGIGIPADERNRIFDVFYRGKNIEVEGTGLGLAIALKTVDRAGGRIRVESSSNKGSTFVVTLPRKRK